MRMIVGLDRPTSGAVTVNGRPYRDHPDPLRQVGALLETGSAHRGRRARTHLVALAQTHGIPRARVGEVLAAVGLQAAAGRRAGGYSLGMRQRLGIAAALLGDPAVVILDEPVNGLDPDGVLWIRELLKGLAAEGRTVLVSSHLMSEMALTAERLVVIGRGRLLADTTVDELISRPASAACWSARRTRRAPRRPAGHRRRRHQRGARDAARHRRRRRAHRRPRPRQRPGPPRADAATRVARGGVPGS
jgi:ABC-2 type transport system ATP-binding protein